MGLVAIITAWYGSYNASKGVHLGIQKILCMGAKAEKFQCCWKTPEIGSLKLEQKNTTSKYKD